MQEPSKAEYESMFRKVKVALKTAKEWDVYKYRCANIRSEERTDQDYADQETRASDQNMGRRKQGAVRVQKV